VLSALPSQSDDRVLVDFRTSDDAGVYKWESGPALVQTVDFFTPIVDDPYTYGQIAAANSLSDVYAMGGRPLTALAICAFPTTALESDTLRAIFLGGLDKLREAGVALLGGHSVQDPEIKFGYAVTGSVDPARVLTNANAQPGDALILTKPLGTGVVGTAIKFDRIPPSVAEEAVRSMRTLNRAASEVLNSMPPGLVHACTDVTGFGLVGHSSEMAAASGVTMVIEGTRVPHFEGVLPLVQQNRSGGMASNQDHFGRGVDVRASVSAEILALVYDPQTSGGLLIAVEKESAERLAAALEAAGVLAARIGEVRPSVPGVRVVVRP
jgi:selenide, water dikinase